MTHDGFLQEILDDPDDDGLRLIYADWLEERGDPRGEFIRVQFELERVNSEERRSQLVVREQGLLQKHEREWTREVQGLASSWVFRRGFIERVSVDAYEIVDSIDEVFRLIPVRHLKVYWPSDSKSVSHEERTRLHRTLACCPHLGRLTSLDLCRTHLRNDGIQALVVSEYLEKLVDLNLSLNRIGDVGVRALAHSPLLARLNHLDLSSNRIGPSGLRALAAALETHGDGARLRHLYLHGNPLESTGVGVICGSPALKRVAKWWGGPAI
jgi:uncharacterized protein (TIGR02996 family)